MLRSIRGGSATTITRPVTTNALVRRPGVTAVAAASGFPVAARRRREPRCQTSQAPGRTCEVENVASGKILTGPGNPPRREPPVPWLAGPHRTTGEHGGSPAALSGASPPRRTLARRRNCAQSESCPVGASAQTGRGLRFPRLGLSQQRNGGLDPSAPYHAHIPAGIASVVTERPRDVLARSGSGYRGPTGHRPTPCGGRGGPGRGGQAARNSSFIAQPDPGL
jgi:hypothetical protein